MAINSQSYLRQKRVKKKKVKLLLYCLSGAVLIAAIFYFLFFSGYLNIKKISVLGVEDPIAGEINRNVSEAVSGRRFFLPRGNILIFSGKKTAEMLEKDFPVLDNIAVRRQFPDKLIVTAQERQKVGIVCGGLSADAVKCFYFDGHGVIFAESPEIIGAAILLFKDDSVLGISLPYQKYSDKTVSFIQEIKKDFLDKAGIGTEYFYFLNSSSDIAAHTDKNFDIYLASDSQRSGEQARVLKSVLDSEIKDRISALDYIDLRIENRAYYKLRE